MTKGTTRDPSKELFWRRMSERQGRSRLSVRAWCREHGVKEATFHWWRRELARRDAEGKTSSHRRATKRSSFLPVHVVEEGPRAPDAHIEILLTDRRRIRVHGSVDRQALADVLAVLEHRGC